MTRWAPVACLTALVWGCVAGRGLDPRTAGFPPIDFEAPVPAEATLSGGARVFLVEDHDVPLVRLYLGFRGGSLYDPPEKAGLAEVAALSWRTGGVAGMSPEAVDEALESTGMGLSLSLGREKGWVTLSLLPPDLSAGLDLLARAVFEPAFREDRVDWAVTQVTERIQRETDDPERLAFRELRRVLYGDHPRGVVATLETVHRVRRDDVLALHRRVLREGVWVVGAAGDFESESLLQELETRFAALPSSGGEFAPLPAPSEPEPRIFLVRKLLPQSTIVWARLGPARTDPRFYPLDLADYVVGSGGFQARLVREIRSNRGLAYSVGSFYEALPDFGVLGAFAQTKVESTLEVTDLMRELLAQVAASGLEAAEVERAKEALINRHVFRYQDPANAVRDQMRLSLDGLPSDLLASFPARIAAVSPRDVAEATRASYDQSFGVTVVVGDLTPDHPHWRHGPPVTAVDVE